MSKNVIIKGVSPAEAKGLLQGLKLSEINRTKVEDIKSAIYAGFVPFDGVPIRINRNSEVVDGLHRLVALSELENSNHQLQLVIVRGLDLSRKEAQEKHDKYLEQPPVLVQDILTEIEPTPAIEISGLGAKQKRQLRDILRKMKNHTNFIRIAVTKQEDQALKKSNHYSEDHQLIRFQRILNQSLDLSSNLNQFIIENDPEPNADKATQKVEEKTKPVVAPPAKEELLEEVIAKLPVTAAPTRRLAQPNNKPIPPAPRPAKATPSTPPAVTPPPLPKGKSTSIPRIATAIDLLQAFNTEAEAWFNGCWIKNETAKPTVDDFSTRPETLEKITDWIIENQDLIKRLPLPWHAVSIPTLISGSKDFATWTKFLELIADTEPEKTGQNGAIWMLQHRLNQRGRSVMFESHKVVITALVLKAWSAWSVATNESPTPKLITPMDGYTWRNFPSVRLSQFTARKKR